MRSTTACKRSVVLERLSGVALAAVVLAFGSLAEAELNQTLLRAADGTAYQVLWVANLPPGAEAIRVTTLAGSATGASACVIDGAAAGAPVSARGGTGIGATLHPYADARRTFVLSPNDVTQLSFDDSFSGRLTLGSGTGALNVCAFPFDCTGSTNVQSLVGLQSTLGGVPAACTAAGLNADCDPGNPRDAFSFGVPSSGMPPVCNSPAQVTVNSTLCAAQPADGFDLTVGQAIVFIYGGSLQQSGFSISVGGFEITTDSVNPLGCPANSIVDAVALVPSSEPTGFIPTPTGAATLTPTPAAPGTATATHSFTPTRSGPAPIPVIGSPSDIAGALLIIGLALALLYAIRSARRSR